MLSIYLYMNCDELILPLRDVTGWHEPVDDMGVMVTSPLGHGKDCDMVTGVYDSMMLVHKLSWL